MTNNNESFWMWVQREMESRDFNFYKLERAAGLSNAAISRPAREWATPSYTICKAIAEGLGLPLEEVLRRAGLLDPKLEDQVRDERLLHTLQEIAEILSQLPPDLQDRLAATIVTQAQALQIVYEAAQREAAAKTEGQEQQQSHNSRK
jgi:transcriptional regulator with XRE-family HTH domain